MTTTSESTETLIAQLLEIAAWPEIGDDAAVKLSAAAQRMSEMHSLIDGAYDIVEIHNTSGSLYAEVWRKRWMESARKCGAVPSP